MRSGRAPSPCRPELLPRRIVVGDRTETDLALGPVRRRLTERVGRVVRPSEPEEVSTPRELPVAIDTDVPVVVLDQLLDEPFALAGGTGRGVVDEPVGPDAASRLVGANVGQGLDFRVVDQTPKVGSIE